MKIRDVSSCFGGTGITLSRPSSVSKCEAGGVADIGVQLAVAQEAFWEKTLGLWISLGIL